MKPIVFDSSTFINTRSDIKAVDKDIQLTFSSAAGGERQTKTRVWCALRSHVWLWRIPHAIFTHGNGKTAYGKMVIKNKQGQRGKFKWKAESLNQQKQMMTNEFSGMAYGMRNDIALKKKQVDLYQKYSSCFTEKFSNHAIRLRAEYRRIIYAL